MDARSTSPAGAGEPDPTPHSPAGGTARVVEVAGVRLAVGLEWHPVARPEDPGPELRQARVAGHRLVARLPDGALLGLARTLDGAPRLPWRPVYCAVGLLVARFAERGVEACLIDAGGPVAFIGLMERRPVPDFDRLLPDLDAALAVLQEFRDMHPDQEVRVAGHLPGRDRIGEALSPELLFGQPDGDWRLRPLLPTRWPAALAAALAALGLIAGFALWWRHERAIERDMAVAARETAATASARAQAGAERTRQLAERLRQAGRPGASSLDRWRAAIAALPLTRAGWTLQQVDCDRMLGCVATWARHHGSFETLDALPSGAIGPPWIPADLAVGDDLLAASMRTSLVDTLELPLRPGEALSAARLPPLRLAVNVWGSHLQDLATAGSAEATLLPGVPLDAPEAGAAANVAGAAGVAGAASAAGGGKAGVGGPAAPRRIVRMSWRLKDGVWSLPLLQVPPYVVVETLTLNFASSHISYDLSGSLFAQGAHGAHY